MIASTDLASAATSYTFSGLSGDSDGEYQIDARIVAGNNSNNNCYEVYPNADMTSADYHETEMFSTGSSPGGGTNSHGGLDLGYSTASAQVTFGNMILYAKSGQIRQAITLQNQMGTASSASTDMAVSSWSNTSSAITSLQISSANCFGELFKQRPWCRDAS